MRLSRPGGLVSVTMPQGQALLSPIIAYIIVSVVTGVIISFRVGPNSHPVRQTDSPIEVDVVVLAGRY